MEKLLNQLWHLYIDRQYRDLTGNLASRKQLEKLDGRDYTASVLTEILFLAGLVPASIRADMEIVRKARNRWVHSVEDPLDDVASRAVQVARDMFHQIHGIDITLSVEKGKDDGE